MQPFLYSFISQILSFLQKPAKRYNINDALDAIDGSDSEFSELSSDDDDNEWSPVDNTIYKWEHAERFI